MSLSTADAPRRPAGPPHPHAHRAPDAGAVPEAKRSRSWAPRASLRPILVGVAHGMAGSAALTLMVLAQMRTAVEGFLYLGSFGIGSAAGMTLASGLMGMPLARSAGRQESLNRTLRGLASVVSIVLGFVMMHSIGAGAGLFR